MASDTINEWPEQPVNRRAIEKYVDHVLKDPADKDPAGIDMETFILIEECNAWHEEYEKILREKRKNS